MKSRGRHLFVILVVCLTSLAAVLTSAPALAHSLESATGGAVRRPSSSMQSPPAAVISASQSQSPPASPGLRARFERISTADGLSFPSVNTVFQDRQGFMWFGTESGLNRYDGYAFTVYKSDPGDPAALFSDSVSSILEDRDGNFWIGTAGGVERLDRETGAMDHTSPLWGRGQIYCLYEDSAGMLWAGHWTGLYGFGFDRRIGDQRLSYHHDPRTPDDPAGLSSNLVIAIHEDQQGDLWIGTTGGLDRMDRTTETFTHYRHDPDDPTSLGDNNVQAIYEDRQGVLWVGTSRGGLSQFDRSSGTFIRHQHDPEDPRSLSDDRVTAILEDSTGALWIGTVNGLNQLDRSSGTFIRYRHDPLDPYSLSDDVVHGLYEDRSGVLWIATANGLSKYNRRASQFTYYLERSAAAGNLDPQPLGLSASKVLALYEDQEGVLWVGTHRGLNRLDRQAGKLTVYRHDPDDPASLSDDVVYAMYEDRSGVLWIGTGSGWLDKFDPQTGGFLHDRYLPTGASVIAEDLTGNLWIGTWNNGLYRLNRDAQNYEHYLDRPDGSLSHRNVMSMLVDRAGALWVGLYSWGINLLEDVNVEYPARFKSYQHDPGDPNSIGHGRVISMYEDPTLDGVLWLGLLGGGLNRFDRATQTFTHYTEEDGLPGDTVGCILADSDGFLWLQTTSGLSKFDPRTGTFRNYDERDGVIGGVSVFRGICLQSRTGEMFFGGSDGLYAFYPEQIQDNLYVPPIVVTTMEVSNQVVRRDLLPGEQVQLPYWDNTIYFEFAALDYTIPQKNQYAYMLEGLEGEWVYAGTRHFVEYRNLPPGDYVFRVKGSNNDGVWNEQGIAVTITIAPPFWETWWFRGIVALVVVGGVVAGYWLRVRSIEGRSRELERQVEDRTHEIERRRQELEALYRADSELHRYLSLDMVLQALVDIAVGILHADKGTLLAWDDRRERLVVRASRGFSPETLARMSFAPGQGSAGRVAVTGEPIIVVDTRTDSRATEQITEPEGIRSFMQVPIEVGGEVFGVFSADYVRPHSFDDDEQRLLIALAQRAARAIENAQLYERTQELVAVEERQRLARELHDAVTQTLFSASLLAEAVPASWERDEKEGRQLLQELRQLSRGALAEMRTLLLELRPAALVETSLGDLLHQLAEAVTGREGIPVAVAVEGECALPPDVHVAFYRIAQEALNNVVKHARAGRVAVRLRCTSHPATEAAGEPRARIELSVRDDGRGFDPTNITPDRLGLGIMRERAEGIGATLQIESEPGEGTQVRVVWGGDEEPRTKGKGGMTDAL